MNRVDWVDNAKAIAIFLVVFAHFKGLGAPLKYFIYAFHLPVFLLISGFLMKTKFTELCLSRFLTSQLYSLIKLYLFFSLCAIGVFIGAAYLNDHSVDYLNLFTSMIYGAHGIERLLGHANGALWYFPFFVSSMFLFYFLLHLPPVLGWSVAILLALLGTSYSGQRLPWSLDVAGVGALFLLLGGALKSYYVSLSFLFNSKISLYLTPLVIALLYALTELNGMANINRLLFGQSPFLYFANAILGMYLVLVFAHHITPSRLMTLVSTHSLVIFSIHLYFVKSLQFVRYIDNTSLRITCTLLLSLLITFLCLQISRFIMPFLNQYILTNSRKA